MKGVLRESWIFDSKELISCPPLVIDGHIKERARIILATRKGKLFVLDRNGNIDWVFDSAATFSQTEQLFLDEDEINTISSKPIIVHDKEEGLRKIIFGSENGTLYCVTNEGKLAWKIVTNGPIRGSPLYVKKDSGDSEIVFGSHDNHIYIINLDGKVIKQIEVHEAIETTPVYLGKHFVFGTKEGEIVAVNEEGVKLWNFTTSKKFTAKVVVTNNKEEPLLLAPSQDNNLYALSTDGELLWHFPTSGALLSEVAVFQSDPDTKEVVFGSCDNSIYCVNTEGELLWSYETEFWVTATPIVNKTKDQTFIIAGSYDHYVYVLDGLGSFELNYIPGLSGVINQSTFQTASMSADVGEDKGKLLDKFHTDSFIVGCDIISSTNEVLVVTKKGKLYNLEMK